MIRLLLLAGPFALIGLCYLGNRWLVVDATRKLRAARQAEAERERQRQLSADGCCWDGEEESNAA